MLQIINNLTPFFEDNFERIHVRAFARIQGISPPTASRLLESLHNEGLLKKEIDKRHTCYFANKSSTLFRNLQRIYFKDRLFASGLITQIRDEMVEPLVILFGSLAKAEARKESDIDIAIFTVTKKDIDLSRSAKQLKREIQALMFENLDDVPDNLKKSILNGYLIEGGW